MLSFVFVLLSVMVMACCVLTHLLHWGFSTHRIVMKPGVSKCVWGGGWMDGCVELETVCMHACMYPCACMCSVWSQVWSAYASTTCVSAQLPRHTHCSCSAMY